MLGVMFQKLLSKKWMFLCLLLGSVLLTATMVSFPMYKSAVFDRMLRSEFQNSLTDTGVWPATLTAETLMTNDAGVRESVSETEAEMANYGKQLGVEIMEDIKLYRTHCKLALASGRTDIDINYLCPAMLTDLPNHATMLSGEMYSKDGLAEDGSIEVVISESCMAKSNLLLNDILRFNLTDGSTISFKIVGVFRKNEDRYYWEASTDLLPNLCLMQEEQFRNLFLSETLKDVYYSISFHYYLMFDYERLKASQADRLLSNITKSFYQGDTCTQLLESYLQKQPMISATLSLLEIPVLILLGAFLFMVSGQMYELEKNEISVIKSRGSSAFQIFRLYLYQSLFLASLGTVLGLLLGFYFVRILGSASNFLEFELRRNLEIQFEPRLWFYVAAAALATVLIMALPAIRHSKVSIVHLKQKKNNRKRPLWEYFCLDIICLGVGYYGYYNYTHNDPKIAESVLAGQSMDPLLYLSSSLFIVGAGLLFLRLQPLLVRLVYVAGKRFWHPASYASFLDNLKNGRKQQFIMLFLILTVSLGTFYATVARTILQNAQNNVEYLDGGADIVIKELWKSNLATVKGQIATAAAYPEANIQIDRLRYYDADFTKYNTLGAKLCTKVYYDDVFSTPGAWCYVTKDLQDDEKKSVTFMGIQTKEFGESTWLDRELTEKHFYTYLNTLADNPEGILVSRNFQTILDYKVGDQVWCCYQPQLERQATSTLLAQYTILDFVDYWPGFDPTTTVFTGSEEVVTVENYLVVANAATLQSIIPSAVIPYEVWITLDEGMDSSDVVQWINDNNVKVEKYVDLQADLQETLEDPLLQGTNGILTMSFLVMLLLCGVGYLIYWVMSIRSRELIFGTLRAFGMHKGELFHILILEQIFSGILSLLAGIGIGRLASDMYVPLLQTAYAAANQALPIKLLTNAQDMVRLYGTVTLMMVFCLTVLVILVLRLNITKALKLGEE